MVLCVFVFTLTLDSDQTGVNLRTMASGRTAPAVVSNVELLAPTQKPIVPLPNFTGAIFSGHRDPDLDSVASAIGAAYLFNGTATVPGVVNAESAYVLNEFQVAAPVRLKTVYVNQPYVILDHNAFDQVPRILQRKNIKGIIDHHTLSQKPVYIPHPEFVYIRRWGSCSTIIASLYAQYFVEMPEHIAGVLLGGILSDTLALTGPTTTRTDVSIAKWLATKTGVPPSLNAIKQIAKGQFRAKANVTGASIEKILNSDRKEYSFKANAGKDEVRLGWSTIESVEPFYSSYLQPKRLAELRRVIARMKAASKLDFMFVSVVDILEKDSVFLGAGKAELKLLRNAFPARTIKAGMMNSTPLVSRKKQFLPPIREALFRSKLG